MDFKNIRLQPTADGSYTLALPDRNETYHSVHGARRESMHVFIRAGLEAFYKKFSPTKIAVGEAGFGTGLNAWLTYRWSMDNRVPVVYETYEKFPVPESLIRSFAQSDPALAGDPVFLKLHEVPWEREAEIGPYFRLIKHQADFREIEGKDRWDVFYFDAFSPRVQPELWDADMMHRMYEALRPGGVWVTYSAKGSVRRNLAAAGFEVEKLPGPPGKREMLRARK